MLIVVISTYADDILDWTWYGRVVQSSGSLVWRSCGEGTLIIIERHQTMSVNHRDPKGDRRTVRQPQLESAKTSRPQDTILTTPPSALTAAATERFLPNMRILCTRHDGWLRVVPDRDTELVFWKWKFTRGIWSGYYIMVRCMYWEEALAVQLLVDKLLEVDAGYRNPTPDRPYEPS